MNWPGTRPGQFTKRPSAAAQGLQTASEHLDAALDAFAAATGCRMSNCRCSAQGGGDADFDKFRFHVKSIGCLDWKVESEADSVGRRPHFRVPTHRRTFYCQRRLVTPAVDGLRTGRRRRHGAGPRQASHVHALNDSAFVVRTTSAHRRS